MRERVHHPAGTRELQQLLRIPREERVAFRRHLKALVGSGDLIQKQALDAGMITLRHSGLRKVRQGLTTVEEVLAVVADQE